MCIFCDIANRTISDDIWMEDEKTMCLFPKEMEVYGHMLIVPKKHYETLIDIDLETLDAVMHMTQKAAHIIKEKLGATGFNILHASGKDADQSVNHFHWHLLPRYQGDGINTWPPLPPIGFHKKEVMDKLK